MLLRLLPFLSVIILAIASPPSPPPSTVTIAYQPLPTSATAKPSSPKQLAILSYHAENTSYVLTSWHGPPSRISKDSTGLARVGILPRSKDERILDNGFAAPSTMVTLLETLTKPEEAVLRIVLNADFSVFSASVGKDVEVRTVKVKGKGKDVLAKEPRLEIQYAGPAPVPVFNKPVVLDKDGKMPAQEKPEPSLLQRYWWVLAILMLFTVFGGGGDEGKK